MTIVGVDEVGRGCIAGPVVAGAVILPEHFRRPRNAGWRLTDSKLMAKVERELAAAHLSKTAAAYGIGWASNTEIDEFGLTAAVRLAMYRAVQAITVSFDHIVIDGNFNFLRPYPELSARVKTIIKADQHVPAVSAASILAKVARDTFMINAAQEHPHYGFESHVGYATSQHRRALSEHGACTLHRLSFKPLQI